MWAKLIFLTVCLGVCTSQTGLTPWDSLKVKWGRPGEPGVFEEMPRTVGDAQAKGFRKISDCNDNDPWRGASYAKDGDYALVLLFGRSGDIAGIQSRLPKNQTNGYPSVHVRPPFVDSGDHYVVTAYFTDPSYICRSSTAKKAQKRSFGPNLYIQNSTRPEDSILIPDNESGLLNSIWKEGLCFPTMGKHYWWNLSEDISCDRTFPFFLLYTGQRLIGFGWAFVTDLSSPRYEHPSAMSYKMFMNPVPKCLASAGVTSSMHVYFTSQPERIAC
ncbi:hypothetical protein BsWGS_01820 [Bradybaena similaris]